MKKIVRLIFILAVLGCSDKKISNNEILEDLLLQIVNQNIGFDKHDSIKTIVIGIDENLLLLKDYEIDQLKSIRGILGIYFADKLPEIDSVPFVEPITNLIYQKYSRSDSISIPVVKAEGNVEIIPSRQIKLKYPKEQVDTAKVQLGRYLRLSNIYLDKKQKNGLFVFDYYCGGECGQGNLVFIKLIDGKWVIIEQEVLWVS